MHGRNEGHTALCRLIFLVSGDVRNTCQRNCRIALVAFFFKRNCKPGPATDKTQIWIPLNISTGNSKTSLCAQTAKPHKSTTAVPGKRRTCPRLIIKTHAWLHGTGVQPALQPRAHNRPGGLITRPSRKYHSGTIQAHPHQ